MKTSYCSFADDQLSMRTMHESTKRQILETIFSAFETWAASFDLVCEKGCDICCTQDVMMGKEEALLLLEYAVGEHGPEWLAQKLNTPRAHHPLYQTTNEYAAACLAGKETVEKDVRRGGRCPFLEQAVCTVYPARPFSCRCFASTQVCRRHTSAVLPAPYLSAATAVSQVIEHLGQSAPWGNMLDVLYLLAPPSMIITTGPNHLENQAIARSNCLTARPLPGFLIGDKEIDQVSRLLDMIFGSPVDGYAGKTVEDILNNR